MPLRVGDDTDKVVDPYHLRIAGQAVDEAIVDVLDVGAEGGWPDDSTVKHALDTHFLHVLEGAFGLGRDVDARDGFSEHPPCGRSVRHGPRIYGKIKLPSLDQLTVAHRTSRISVD